MKNSSLNSGSPLHSKGVINIFSLFTFLALLLSVNIADCYGATVSWLNPMSGNWNDPDNWSSGSVPQPSDDVVISIDGTYTVTLNGDVTASSIIVGGGAGTQTLMIQGAVVDAQVINKGMMIARWDCTFNGAFENQAEGRLVVEGVYYHQANLTVANGFANYGTIDLTNNRSNYYAKLLITDGTLVNYGTINSLPGVGGGGRYIYGALDNQGTLQVDQGLEISKASAAHTNSGTINVSGGNLTLSQSGTDASFTNTGTIAIASGKNATVNGGLFTPGVESINGLLTLNSAVLGTGTLSSELTVVMSNSQTAGILYNKGFIRIHDNCAFSGTFENQAGGIVAVTGHYGGAWHSSLTIANGFSNYGEIQLTNTRSGYNATLAVTSGTLVNHGIINSLNGLGGGARRLYGELDNQGTVQVDYGLLVSKASAAHVNSGTINVANGKTLTVSGNANFTNLVDGIIQGSGILNVSNAFLTNEGIINPGYGVGTLSITGNITQRGTGSLGIEIGGTVAGTDYDQLKVSGTGSLGGTLNITFADGYFPQSTDTYQIMTYGSYTGEFSVISPPIISGTRDWSINYTATGIQLSAIEAAAGVRLIMGDGPDPVALFHELTYNLTVVNGSTAETATNVVVTDVLPPSALFASVTSSQGTCTENSGTVTCTIGDLAPEAYASIAITVVPTFISTIENTATVTSDSLDPNPDDNSYTISSVVTDLPDGYDIIDTPVGLGVTDLSSRYYGNVANAQITVNGIGFDSLTEFYLVGPDGTIYYPTSIEVDSLFQITLTFDFSQIPVGRYDIMVANGSESRLLANAFEVVETQKPKLETRLVLPGILGRRALSTIYVEYKNAGNVAMPAPMLSLVSTDADNSDKPILTMDNSNLIRSFWSEMPTGTDHSVQFLADGDGDSPGVLMPGETGRVPIYYLGLLQPWDFSDGRVEMGIIITNTDEPTPYAWDARHEHMKPASMEQAAWDILHANLSADVGPTWGDYVATLGENASFIYRHGGKKVSDSHALMKFEMLQAIGHSPISYLAGGTDIAIQAPGMPIVFGSMYRNSIVTRHANGPLGKGWAHNWQMSIEEDADGNVQFNYMNGSVRYTLDSRGGYFPPDGNYTTLTKNGDIFTITAPGGVKTVFNANGTVNYIEDLNGNRITAEYSGSMLSRLVHSSGQYLSINYSGSLIQSVTDNTGHLSVLYDYSGDNLSSVQDVLGRTTSYTYHSFGASAQALATVSMPDGTESYYSYDTGGRLSELNYNGNPPVTVAYDGGMIAVTDTADNSVSKFYYDDDGNFIKHQNPNNQITLAKYDDNYNLTSFTQPDGYRSTFSYDDKGNMNLLVDQLKQETQFGYSAFSRLAYFKDAEQKTTQYTYDIQGNNTARISPDLSEQTYGFDVTGELNQMTNRRGTPVSIARNTRGQVSRIDYADATFTAYTYNAIGNVLSVEDTTGITTLDYYPNNLLQRITYPGNRFLEYTYDTAGRRTSSTDHTGYRLNYAYNFDGKLERITANDGTTPVRYEYDLQGRLSKRILGNGVSTSYQYDMADRIIQIDTTDSVSALISSYGYEYDALDRRTKVTSRDGEWDYTYDPTGQLTHAVFTSSNGDIPSKAIEYVYDKVGNRVQEIVDGATTSYNVNNMNQYIQNGNFTYSYDLDGNLTGKTNGIDTFTYEYNDNNRLIRSTGPGGVKEYTYNGLGHLATVIDNGVEKHYMVDPIGFGNVVGEYDATGTLVSRYTHGYGLVGKDDTYYTFDGNGNTSEMTNAANEIVNVYVYEPFGKSMYEVETTDNDFGFVGQFGVREMGNDLIYMRNRFYAPSTGRFMSEDPIGLAGGDVNFNRYVKNNPVNWVDPEGLAGRGINYDPNWRGRPSGWNPADAGPKPPSPLPQNYNPNGINNLPGKPMPISPNGSRGAR
ncbi:MAG: DUF6531 domain-containing protein, partial [Desulfobulbaceae bacterium]|nr:DUF6531 domain-containing protein [Desulfobulbaceae bacterium]